MYRNCLRRVTHRSATVIIYYAPVTWDQKPLRYGGVCKSCGAEIGRREIGWHNQVLRIVRCSKCGAGPETQIPTVDDSEVTPRVDPVGGTSALRDGRARRSDSFKKGAVGEYLVDKYFQENLPAGTPILTDRLIPGTSANVDHIVIVPSGVWVIDSKLWTGRIEYKTAKATSLDLRLYVDGKDRTCEVEKFYELVIPVAQIVEDKSVRINAAFCFVNGDWGLINLIRHRRGKTDRHMDVYLASRTALGILLSKPGPLSQDTISGLYAKLNDRLAPRQSLPLVSIKLV